MASYHSKMVRKSMYWSKHGRRDWTGTMLERERLLAVPKRESSMYGSVAELMEADRDHCKASKSKPRYRRRKTRRGAVQLERIDA